MGIDVREKMPRRRPHCRLISSELKPTASTAERNFCLLRQRMASEYGSATRRRIAGTVRAAELVGARRLSGIAFTAWLDRAEPHDSCDWISFASLGLTPS